MYIFIGRVNLSRDTSSIRSVIYLASQNVLVVVSSTESVLYIAGVLRLDAFH